MPDWRARTAYFAGGIGGLILVFSLLYHVGMIVFEGETASFLHSLQVVVETFTTTGFGSDAPWESPAMNLLVILMDITGVLVIFLALPVFVFPLLEDTLSTTVPVAVSDLDGHVVICSYSPRGETLIDELGSWDMDYVVVEDDRETAVDLYEAGYDVIHGDPESIAALENARAGAASAVVTDGSDARNASITLAAREVSEDVRIITFVEDPASETYHRYAGADHVFSPRQLLGQSLASKVTAAVSAGLGDVIEVTEDLEIVEFQIQPGSELAGETLAESAIGERTGADVIGGWFRGEFESPPSPETTLAVHTTLVVAGSEPQLERVQELTRSDTRRFEHGRVVVVGLGMVGRTVSRALDAADIPYTVLDLETGEDVDVVGDVTDPETLAELDLTDVRTMMLAIGDDTATISAALAIRAIDADVEVIARANDTENAPKMYRAGADYVLALATVSGRLLASTIIEGEEVIAFDKQIEVVRTSAETLTGRSLADADVRSRTGCTVLAVERAGRVHTDLDASFVLEPGDEVVIAGTDENINRFTALAH